MIALDSSASAQTCQIGSRVRLGKSLAPDDFALQDPGKMVLPLGLGAICHDGRTRMVQCDEAQVMVGRIRARIFLVPDELPGKRESKSAIFLRPGDARPSGLILKRLPSEVVRARGSSGVGSPLSRDMFMEPVARLSAECNVFGREVQVQTAPRGFPSPSGAYSRF